MLWRLSTLSVYVAASLVVSAVATPTEPRPPCSDGTISLQYLNATYPPSSAPPLPSLSKPYLEETPKPEERPYPPPPPPPKAPSEEMPKPERPYPPPPPPPVSYLEKPYYVVPPKEEIPYYPVPLKEEKPKPEENSYYSPPPPPPPKEEKPKPEETPYASPPPPPPPKEEKPYPSLPSPPSPQSYYPEKTKPEDKPYLPLPAPPRGEKPYPEESAYSSPSPSPNYYPEEKPYGPSSPKPKPSEKPYVLPPPAPKPYTQENGKPGEKQKPEAPKAAGCAMDKQQCCNELSNASDPQTAILLSTLGIEAQGDDTLVGMGCSPISALGGEGKGGKCTATPLCCGQSHPSGTAVACQRLDSY